MTPLSRREFLRLAGVSTGLGALGSFGGCPAVLPAAPASTGPFEYIVVLMMENRSFDNLLGYLYEPGAVPRGQAFDGVAGRDFSTRFRRARIRPSAAARRSRVAPR